MFLLLICLFMCVVVFHTYYIVYIKIICVHILQIIRFWAETWVDLLYTASSILSKNTFGRIVAYNVHSHSGILGL